jgi:hypothetical protein
MFPEPSGPAHPSGHIASVCRVYRAGPRTGKGVASNERLRSGRPLRSLPVTSLRINALARHEKDVSEVALRESRRQVAGARLDVPSSTPES